MKIIVNKDISIRNFILITILAMLLGTGALYIAIKGFVNVNMNLIYFRNFTKIDCR